MADVFIGIPTLNRPQLVRQTIQSVLAQSYRSYRVVVSDNCSDGNASLDVARYVRELGDERFSFYRQPEDGGEYGQGRYFFKEAQNHEFFMILHDDDVLGKEYLERAVAALREHRSADLFVANPFAISQEGKRCDELTDWYLTEHGRTGQADGLFELLPSSLATGFAPISGTLFRMAALQKSGFVDEDCHGNYPFELNVMLRLGDCGARGYFSSKELLGFRFHQDSMRNYIQVFDNPRVVGTVIRLLERRRYSGGSERRRREVLARLYRAQSLLSLRTGDYPASREFIMKALRLNVRSLRALMLAPLLLTMPGMVRRMLPALPKAKEGPSLSA